MLMHSSRLSCVRTCATLCWVIWDIDRIL
jgi:hypothetical protein